jgi:L-cysteine/cystine lyase
MTFDEIRAQIPVLDRLAYLNAGTFGPLSRATMEAVEREQRRDLLEGRAGGAWYEHVAALRGRARETVAALVGAASRQVALTASTTDGCAIVVAGLGLVAGDEIVTTTDEHFGLLGVLGASPARVVVVPPDPDSILAAVTPRTRLVAVSEVLWTTGAVLPVAAIRSAAGVPVLVDGAQSVGAIQVDALAVDYLTVSGQKWLCGPDATGALVVREPEALPVALPSFFAQASHEPDGTFVPREGALRFEPNWISAGSLAGLATAIEGRPDRAFERAAAQAARLREELAATVELVTPASPSTIVSFRPRSTPAGDLVALLHAQGVIVREIPRRGLVRASVGWWTSDRDLERLVAGVTA